MATAEKFYLLTLPRAREQNHSLCLRRCVLRFRIHNSCAALSLSQSCVQIAIFPRFCTHWPPGFLDWHRLTVLSRNLISKFKRESSVSLQCIKCHWLITSQHFLSGTDTGALMGTLEHSVLGTWKHSFFGTCGRSLSSKTWLTNTIDISKLFKKMDIGKTEKIEICRPAREPRDTFSLASCYTSFVGGKMGSAWND